MHVNSGSFAVSISSVRNFLMGMSYWVEYVVTYLEYNLRQLLFRDLGMVNVTACNKVKSVVAR